MKKDTRTVSDLLNEWNKSINEAIDSETKKHLERLIKSCEEAVDFSEKVNKIDPSVFNKAKSNAGMWHTACKEAKDFIKKSK